MTSNILDRLRNPAMEPAEEEGIKVQRIFEHQARVDMKDAADEIERLRSVIKKAHTCLTKSSLTADERVYDATEFLSRELGRMLK